MITWLVSLFAGRALKAAGAEIKDGWRWLFSSATHVLEVALLLACLFGLYQHRQLSKARDDLEDCRLGRVADIQTWTQRVAEAKAETVRQQNLFTGASKDAQTYHDQLAQADQALLDYKRAHRLPQGAANTLSTTTSGSGGDSSIHGETPGSTLLAITEADIDACDAAYTYAAGAFHLGQTLIQQGQAILQTGTTP